MRGDTEGRRGCDIHHQDPLRPESRIDVGHVPPASDEQTGADEQHDRQRKLRYHEGAADSTAGCSARDTSATLLAGRTQIAAHRRHRGRQSHQDSRQKRDDQSPAEDAEIEARFLQTRQVARAEGTDEVNAYRGEQCANQARDGAKHDAFGEQLSHDPSATRSKRRANGHLAPASGAARQRKAGDVGSGDHEHAKHRAAEHPQCQSRLRSDHVKTQWDDADALSSFSRGQLIVQAAGDRAHLRLGLVERHGRSKSSHDEPRLTTAHAAVGRVRFPHVCIEPRDPEISREDADDLGRQPVEHEARSDRIVRASETGLPEAMTNQDQSFLLLGFVARKATSPHGLDTEEWKEVGGNAGAAIRRWGTVPPIFFFFLFFFFFCLARRIAITFWKIAPAKRTTIPPGHLHRFVGSKVDGEKSRAMRYSATLRSFFTSASPCDQSLCQKIFSIVAEMVSNAIDHGLLKLSSES